MQTPMLAIAATVILAIAGGAVYLATVDDPAPATPPSLARLQIGDTAFGAPFELTGTDGARVTSEEVIDGPTLIYFGYTFCPDVCPLDTQILAETVEILAGQGIEVTPVFITVDPERDTPTALGAFTQAVHPELVGLTGEQAEIRAVADAYKVYFERVEMADSYVEYLVNHTAFTYLATPDGVLAVYRNGFPAEEIARDVAGLLAPAS